MHLRHLQTIVAIAEEGTLTAAAARLYKTQGAVSHDLKSIEAELGVELVDRSGQRAVLTSAGQRLLTHAYELLRRTADIEREMRLVADGDSGIVRIGVLPSLSLELGNRISSFHGAYPRVQFAVSDDMHQVLADRLQRGDIDIIVADEIAQGTENLHVTPLGCEPLVVVVRADDELASAAAVTAPEVAARPYVGFDRALGRIRGAEHFFACLGRYPDPVVCATDYRLILELVRQGVGVAIVPLSSVGQDPTLAAIPTNPPLSRDVILAVASNRRLPRAVERFRDHLASSWSGGVASPPASPMISA